MKSNFKSAGLFLAFCIGVAQPAPAPAPNVMRRAVAVCPTAPANTFPFCPKGSASLVTASLAIPDMTVAEWTATAKANFKQILLQQLNAGSYTQFGSQKTCGRAACVMEQSATAAVGSARRRRIESWCGEGGDYLANTCLNAAGAAPDYTEACALKHVDADLVTSLSGEVTLEFNVTSAACATSAALKDLQLFVGGIISKSGIPPTTSLMMKAFGLNRQIHPSVEIKPYVRYDGRPPSDDLVPFWVSAFFLGLCFLCILCCAAMQILFPGQYGMRDNASLEAAREHKMKGIAVRVTDLKKDDEW